MIRILLISAVLLSATWMVAQAAPGGGSGSATGTTGVPGTAQTQSTPGTAQPWHYHPGYSSAGRHDAFRYEPADSSGNGHARSNPTGNHAGNHSANDHSQPNNAEHYDSRIYDRTECHHAEPGTGCNTTAGSGAGSGNCPQAPMPTPNVNNPSTNPPNTNSPQ